MLQFIYPLLLLVAMANNNLLDYSPYLTGVSSARSRRQKCTGLEYLIFPISCVNIAVSSSTSLDPESSSLPLLSKKRQFCFRQSACCQYNVIGIQFLLIEIRNITRISTSAEANSECHTDGCASRDGVPVEYQGRHQIGEFTRV